MDHAASSDAGTAATDATVDANGDVDMGDVTDLGDVAGDTMMEDSLTDLDELVEALDAVDVVDDLDDKQSDDDVAEDTAAAMESEATAEGAAGATTNDESTNEAEVAPPQQSGPFVDIFGETLLSLQFVDETHAQVHQHYTNEILAGKKVVGLYFSADW